jgi:SET domain-containing protein
MTADRYLDIRSSSIHGHGAYARTFIPEGTPVAEYVGKKITKAESLRRCEDNNEYIFYLDDDYDLDGLVAWNPARFLNHCCAPNCEATLDEGRIWLTALQDIPAGAELTFNYGYDLSEYEDHPCRCGAPNCIGFIVSEEYFEIVRERQAAKREAAAPA